MIGVIVISSGFVKGKMVKRLASPYVNGIDQLKEAILNNHEIQHKHEFIKSLALPLHTKQRIYYIFAK